MNLKSNQPSYPRRAHCVQATGLWASHGKGGFLLRKLAIALFASFFVLHGSTAFVLMAKDDQSKSSEKEIQDWIKDLGSEDYSKRQLATLHLGKRKADSIPLVIEAVSEATGEQADRLFQFLSSIAADPHSDSGKLAFDALNELAESRTTSKSIRAEKIIRVIGATQRDLALDLLGACRIPLRDRDLQVMSSNPFVKQPLVIDRQFSGNAEDLACLKWLTDVPFARLEGPKISREILQQVIALPHLKKLQLVETVLTADDLALLKEAPDLDLLEIVYSPIGDESVDTLLSLPVWGNVYLFGTKLTQSGNQSLKSRMEGVDLFISRGGFLGVKAFGNSTVIDDVVPGGAARRDGLLRGDKMLAVNGKTILSFDDLRKELANFADGETVTIEVERSPRVFEFRQGGFGPGGFPGGFPGGGQQGGLPQGGLPQGGLPQGGLPQGGLPPGGGPQGMFPPGGLNRDNQAEDFKREVSREKIKVTLGKRDSYRDR